MSFGNNLIQWYLENDRDLPWRKSKDPYVIWLSEIMLQQTRVAQGLPYFLSFIKHFPTVFDLANAPEAKVLKLWQGLGYYSRARNLHFTAKYVANECNGIFPGTYKDLLKLKGVGDYTASAIASICYQEPVAVVDGNVYRVLARYLGIATPINTTKGIKEFKAVAQELLEPSEPGNYNQALMDFGALHCKPQNPLCSTCIFSESCVAFRSHQVKELPVKEKKLKVKKRYFNYLVVDTEKEATVLEERKGKGIWQGLYQFPLVEGKGEVSEKELLQSARFQELVHHKEVSVSLFNEKAVVHKLSHQHLYTNFWIVNTPSVTEETISWNEVKQKPVPVLIDKFLKEYLKEEL
jgi:A/G-specific adenine glycosylase